VDGSRVVSAISGVPRDSEDRPKEKVVLEKVEVFRVGPPPKPRK